LLLIDLYLTFEEFHPLTLFEYVDLEQAEYDPFIAQTLQTETARLVNEKYIEPLPTHNAEMKSKKIMEICRKSKYLQMAAQHSKRILIVLYTSRSPSEL
jgi:hypothetical protein